MYLKKSYEFIRRAIRWRKWLAVSGFCPFQLSAIKSDACFCATFTGIGSKMYIKYRFFEGDNPRLQFYNKIYIITGCLSTVFECSP